MTKSIAKPTPAIRLSVTPEVGRALMQAKKMYPTLSDPELLKLGLSKIVTSDIAALDEKERKEISRTTT